jgi:hypothetical protein
LAAILCWALAASAAPEGDPAETLNYSVNWPSGLSLGEATLTAWRSPERLRFELSIQASIPAFRVEDRFRSETSADYCSLMFEKDFVHGARKNRERTVFDAARGMAVRETLGGGGKTEFAIPACAKDALAFLFYLRKELEQGRLPAAQTIYYGAGYGIRLDYGGTQRVGEAREEADKVVASVKGPASGTTFEMYFAKDGPRTPVLIRVPLALGSFSLEIVR